jgi:hypothetical protein
MRYVKYCMDVWCSFSIREIIDGLGNLRLGRDLIVGMWMAPLTHVSSISKDWTCQPSVRSLATIGLYF